MTDSSVTITGLEHPSACGKVDVIDAMNRRHRVQIRMEPQNALVRDVFRVCRFALRDSEKAGEGLLVGWWETMKWLRARETCYNDVEWTALVVILFSMAVSFIDGEQTRTPVKQTRRKKGLLRSSSGSYVDLESWEAMLDQESGSFGVVAPWMTGSSWGWVVEQDAEEDLDGRQGKKPSKSEQPAPGRSTFRQNSFLIRCAALAREFFRKSAGL
jgi:anaphase-promoting complex subunit 1